MATFTIDPGSGADIRALADALQKASSGDEIVVATDEMHELALRGAKRLGVKGITVRIAGREK